jgi:hypothetical protein
MFERSGVIICGFKKRSHMHWCIGVIWLTRAKRDVNNLQTITSEMLQEPLNTGHYGIFDSIKAVRRTV